MAAKNHPLPVKHVTCHIKSGDYPLLPKLPMVLGIALINRMWQKYRSGTLLPRGLMRTGSFCFLMVEPSNHAVRKKRKKKGPRGWQATLDIPATVRLSDKSSCVNDPSQHHMTLNNGPVEQHQNSQNTTFEEIINCVFKPLIWEWFIM